MLMLIFITTSNIEFIFNLKFVFIHKVLFEICLDRCTSLVKNGLAQNRSNNKIMFEGVWKYYSYAVSSPERRQ